MSFAITSRPPPPPTAASSRLTAWSEGTALATATAAAPVVYPNMVRVTASVLSIKSQAISALVWGDHQRILFELVELIIQYAREEKFTSRKHTLDSGVYRAMSSANEGRQAVLYSELRDGQEFSVVDLATGEISAKPIQRRYGWGHVDTLVFGEERYWSTVGSSLFSCTDQMGLSAPRFITGMSSESNCVTAMVYDPVFSRLILSTGTDALITFDVSTSTFKKIQKPENLGHVHFIATTPYGVVAVSPRAITIFAPDFSSVFGTQSAGDDGVMTHTFASYDPSIDRLYLAQKSDRPATFVFEFTLSTFDDLRGHYMEPLIALSSFQGAWVCLSEGVLENGSPIQTLVYQNSHTGVVCRQDFVGEMCLERPSYLVENPYMNTSLVLGPRYVCIGGTAANKLQLWEVVPGEVETAAARSLVSAPNSSCYASASGGVTTATVAPFTVTPPNESKASWDHKDQKS